MALIKCPECGRNFSDQADACPDCGCPTPGKRPQKKKSNIAGGILAGIFAVIILLVLALVGVVMLASKNNDEPISETMNKVMENAASGEVLKNENEFEIGETWEVEGQWKITVNSVTETEERNEYSEYDPAAVYQIEYTYENIGYEDQNEIMNGLFIDLSSYQIVDSAGEMGYSYPNDSKSYPTEVPVGAKMTADVSIGVENAGDFEITVLQYDGNGKEQEATFKCSVK